MLYILMTTLALTAPLQRPHLTLAQGIVESHCNQYARGKDKEKGAYQVIERYWVGYRRITPPRHCRPNR